MRRLLLFAALFVLGVGGTGYVVLTAPEQATGPHTLEANPVGDRPENASVVPIANLSTGDRERVAAAVANGSAQAEPDDRSLNGSYVRANGTVYRLRVVVGTPSDGIMTAHLVAVVLGGLTSVVGAVGLAALWMRAWQRSRERAADD